MTKMDLLFNHVVYCKFANKMPVYHFEKPLVLELYRGLPSQVTHVGIPQWCSNTVPTCDRRPWTLPCVKKCVKFSQIAWMYMKYLCICDGLMDLWFLSCVISYYQLYMAQLVDQLYKMFVLTIVHYKSHVRVENDCKYNKIKWSYLRSFNFFVQI